MFSLDLFSEQIASLSDPREASLARTRLGFLSQIKNKRDFKLRVQLTQKVIRLNLWPAAIDTLRPVLQEFMESGAQVKFQWMYQSLEERVKRDLTPLLAEISTDWKTDVIKYLEEVS